MRRTGRTRSCAVLAAPATLLRFFTAEALIPTDSAANTTITILLVAICDVPSTTSQLADSMLQRLLINDLKWMHWSPHVRRRTHSSQDPAHHENDTDAGLRMLHTLLLSLSVIDPPYTTVHVIGVPAFPLTIMSLWLSLKGS